MKDVVCFNCGHTEYHGGDGCTRILENGNYCWCAVEGPGVIVAHEIRVDQRAKFIAYLKALGRSYMFCKSTGMLGAATQVQIRIIDSVAAYRAIVLPTPKERK